MDKSEELDKMFDELAAVIKSCKKDTYSEHWVAVEEYVRRAAFIVYNFHLPLETLEAQLDKEQASAAWFASALKEGVFAPEGSDEQKNC